MPSATSPQIDCLSWFETVLGTVSKSIQCCINYTFAASVVGMAADTTTSNPTRRERKKAATRRAIADAALELFLKRGFDNVSVREIADAADVSPTTVFAHFPCKEAIAVDEDDEMRERLTSAVSDRPDGVSIPDALRKFYREDAWHDDAPEGSHQRFTKLIDDSPSLSDYAQKMWLRHENSLADAIAADLGQQTPDVTVRAFARCALQAQLIDATTAELPAVVNAVFDLLEPGWESYLAGR